MKNFLVYFSVIVLTFMGILALGYTHPDSLSQALRTIDRIGITREGAAERRRIAEINKLLIPYEEKQVLISRTVFIGATPAMVEMALGVPKYRSGSIKDKGVELFTYTYFLPDDKRPTVLEFKNGTLAAAYKSSAINITK